MRLLALFASLASVRPVNVLLFSFSCCVAGSAAMKAVGPSSLPLLTAATLLTGLGMGTVFATGLAWLEQFVALDNGAGTALVVAGSVGPDVFPVLVGQVLEARPVFLLDLQLGTVLACVGLFVAAYVGARGLERRSGGG